MWFGRLKDRLDAVDIKIDQSDNRLREMSTVVIELRTATEELERLLHQMMGEEEPA